MNSYKDVYLNTKKIKEWCKALLWVDSFPYKSKFFGVHKNEAPYLNSTQLGAVIHLNYQSAKAWTGTLQIGTPFQPTIKGEPLPISVRPGIRWRLLQSRNTPTTTTMPVTRKALPEFIAYILHGRKNCILPP